MSEPSTPTADASRALQEADAVREQRALIPSSPKPIAGCRTRMPSSAPPKRRCRSYQAACAAAHDGRSGRAGGRARSHRCERAAADAADPAGESPA
jgi:hypothetical protein